MTVADISTRVAALFGGGPRTTRVGVEQEFLTADAASGAVVAIERVRAAIAGAAYAGSITFEPGGQVELSLPAGPDAAAAGAVFAAVTRQLRSDCAAAGILLEERPVDPRPESSVPLQLTTPRYLRMQDHFDTIGPAGRRMMRRTAATQLCLDWWAGAAGREQWRLLNLAGPALAAAYARSTGPGSRLATWLRVDPARTAFDGRLVGEDPVAAYAGLAIGATRFTAPGDDGEHLSTLFPPVRPRGRYLEVRFLDAQPSGSVAAIARTFAALLYDDDCRTHALRVVASDAARLAQRWEQAAAGDTGVRECGLELVALAAGCARSGPVDLGGAA